MPAILALLLSLILTLAAQTEAVARSEMAGAFDQVLCSTGKGITVTLDATGQPLHGHPCTHCMAATVVADLPGPLAVGTAPLAHPMRLTQTLASQTTGSHSFFAMARAPPGSLA